MSAAVGCIVEDVQSLHVSELELDEAVDLDFQSGWVSQSIYDNGAIKVITGHHQLLGFVHMIFPPIGKCLILTVNILTKNLLPTIQAFAAAAVVFGSIDLPTTSIDNTFLPYTRAPHEHHYSLR